MALVGTMTALVLGLLLASTKGVYDTQSADLTQMSANFVLLDRVLAHYGPETKDVRDLLRSAVGRVADRLLSRDRSDPAHLDPWSGSELMCDKIQQLSPKDETQRWLKGPGVEYCNWSCTNALVHVRAERSRGFRAVGDHADFLAHSYFH
jgi:hypothetical protein